MKRYVFDLDGVICTEQRTFERGFAEVNDKAVELINALYSDGNFIFVFTARGWNEYRQTKGFLDTIGLQYHELIMGKPICDYLVDDRAVGLEELYLANKELFKGT